MIEISGEKILETAKAYNKKGIHWHHHNLTPKCIYNKSGKSQLVLENENSGEVFVANFDKQPTKQLRILEDLFFRQKK